ncbi:ubiquinol-cytochrome c reductase cytochrome b subunit [Actinoallomurus oryzae]|uniref:Cytochrome bc1 complex cytochrome b subunit n=1 Tax=Actinoallomurus oryzae TaxID=502180 RepID=A0ABP8QWY5_9ACTN
MGADRTGGGSRGGAVAKKLDDRLSLAGILRDEVRKAFPEHWSFQLGEIALYSFAILILTGVYLTFFFHPSASEVTYRGSVPLLRGVRMSQAYASTVNISFDVRGGLLIRQIHHWAANLFLAAIMLHLLRIFFTGAFRKPREINWLIGTALFALAILEGFAGYSLPDDLLSGTGLRIAQGIVLSIPVVGTYLSFFIFGGEYPGEDLIPRLFTVHVLLVPGLLLGLITAHMIVLWHQKHTQWPGARQREANVVGDPLFPGFMGSTTAFFFFIFAVLAFLGTAAQINPIWLYGPYRPSLVSSNSQPDWYIGFLEGALRIWPNLTTTVAGHDLIWNVFLPGVGVPATMLALIALYPFFERWATRDARFHDVLDRPRNAPTRTAVGAAAVTAYGVLWAAGGDDVFAAVFQLSIEDVVWFFRIGFVLGPVVAFVVTRRVCLRLQRRDRWRAAYGDLSGVIERLPGGAYRELEVDVGADARARLATRPAEPEPLPRHLIPLPTPNRIRAQVRARMNRLYLSEKKEIVSAQGRPPTDEAETQ